MIESGSVGFARWRRRVSCHCTSWGDLDTKLRGLSRACGLLLGSGQVLFVLIIASAVRCLTARVGWGGWVRGGNGCVLVPKQQLRLRGSYLFCSSWIGSLAFRGVSLGIYA